MEFTRISASRGQINRLRCGQLGRQPVVVAVDAAGGVLVAPTHKSKMSPMKLLNVASGRDQAGDVSLFLVDYCNKQVWSSPYLFQGSY